MDGGLRLDDEPAHQHADGYQDPVLVQGRNLAAQIGAGGQKAHIDAGHEQNQSNISIQEAYHNFQHIFPGHPQGDHLENGEEGCDGGQGRSHFPGVYREALGKQAAQLPAVTGLRHQVGHIGPRRLIHQRQHQHRQNGAHGAQGHQAEAVLPRFAVATGGGYAQAQGHDEGHRHGSGGDAAGIEGHRQKILGGKGRQGKNHNIGGDQQSVEGDLEQDA